MRLRAAGFGVSGLMGAWGLGFGVQGFFAGSLWVSSGVRVYSVWRFRSLRPLSFEPPSTEPENPEVLDLTLEFRVSGLRFRAKGFGFRV